VRKFLIFEFDSWYFIFCDLKVYVYQKENQIIDKLLECVVKSKPQIVQPHAKYLFAPKKSCPRYDDPGSDSESDSGNDVWSYLTKKKLKVVSHHTQFYVDETFNGQWPEDEEHNLYYKFGTTNASNLIVNSLSDNRERLKNISREIIDTSGKSSILLFLKLF
jgi:hypothetical protein